MLKQVISFGAGMLAAVAFWRIVVLNMVRHMMGEQSFWTLLALSCVAFIAVYGAARWLLNERRKVTAGDFLRGIFSLVSGIAGAAVFSIVSMMVMIRFHRPDEPTSNLLWPLIILGLGVFFIVYQGAQRILRKRNTHSH
jgi:uncharacterized membrane protein YobD (UPF0266 family)